MRFKAQTQWNQGGAGMEGAAVPLSHPERSERSAIGAAEDQRDYGLNGFDRFHGSLHNACSSMLNEPMNTL